MLRQQRLSDWDAPSSPATRSQSVASVASDRTSVPRFPSLSSPPPARRPEPAYIVASAASQIVTNVQERDDFDVPAHEEGILSGEPALVTSASLKLVNGFLDHLLYNFLGVARSTSLGPLRAAVCEVLRPSLARDAIAGADQELHEYLGVGLEKELAASHEVLDPGTGWDLDAVWRRTRLRCMVYSSLGDMEEEDEGSIASSDDRPTSATQPNGRALEEQRMVVPAVAIFLASILEFLGEQILLLAGQTAVQRLQSKKLETSAHEGGSVTSELIDRLVVEEQDVEKVALNPSIGRLWRSWRKRLRSPSTSFSRSISRDSFFSRRSHAGFAGSSRRSSVETMEASTVAHERSRPASLMEVPEEDVAANIALPMSDNDVEEIEVPGVADMRDESRLQSRLDGLDGPRRRRSLTVLTGRSRHDPASDDFQPPQGSTSHGRSRSVPTLGLAHFNAGPEQSPDDAAFFTPLQSPDQWRGPMTDSAASQQQPGPFGREPTSAVEMGQRHHGYDGGDHVTHGDDAAWSGERTPRSYADEPRSAAGSSQSPYPAQSAPGPGGEPSDIALMQRQSASERAADLDEAKHRGLRTVMSLGNRRPMAAVNNKESVSDGRDVGPSTVSPGSDRLARSPPPTRIEPTADIVAQGDDGEPPADPDAIGVAHTSNVPMLAPLSIPSTRGGARRPGPTLLYPGNEVSRSQASPKQAYRKDHVSEGSQDRADSFEGRQSRRHQDPQNSSLKPDEPYQPNVTGAGMAAVDAHGEAFTRPPRGSGIARSASPLNPLEELTEDFLDTSDEASSIAANQDAMRTDPGVASGSTRSSMASSGNKLSSGSRTSDHRRPVASTATASSTDRASVQRVFTPPTTPSEGAPTKTRRSDSLTKGPGSPQLAHKLKGVLGRSHDEPEKAGRAGRASIDDARGEPAARQTQSQPRSRDTERSFEELIRSDATLQFTLTPPSMREMEASDARRPRIWLLLTAPQGTVRRTDPDSVGFPKKGVVDKPPRHSSRPTVTWNDSTDPQKELQRSSVTPSDAAGPSTARSASGKDAPTALPASNLPPATNRTRPGAPVARDARGDMASTQYFADFIRRTGPNVSNNSPSGQTRALPVRNQSQSSRTGPLSSVSALTGSSRKASTKSSRSGASPRKERPQAREPVVYQRHDTSDLVDFIRQGPPDGKPSISKAIAPFRTTMDSDDFKSLTNGKPIEEAAMTPQSTVSTQNGSSMSQAQSAPSSYNSQAKLLDDPASMMLTEDVPPIRRKQRRVKDPYAIDTDDDLDNDDDDIVPTAAVMKPHRDEESLMDFLRSVPPPSTPSTLPSAFDSASKTSTKTLLKREPSATIKNRFGRTESKKMPKTLVPTKAAPKPASDQPPPGSSSIATEPPQLALQGSGRDGSFIDIQQSLSGVSTNPAEGPATAPGSRMGSTSGPAGDLERSAGAPRPARRVNQPRSAHGDRDDPSALAEFLRNSGPPVPPAPAPVAAPRPREEGGFSKMFRKKKTTTTTGAA